MQKEVYEGRMVVETAILFPLLFLLWMCMLYMLFRMGSQAVGETVSNRCVMICKELGLEQRSEWQSIAQNAAEQYIEKSGMPVELKQLTVEVEEKLLFHRIQVEVVLEYSAWVNEEWVFSKTGYEMGNTSLRNLMDFIWETGEELPVVGQMIREYKDKLSQVREQLGET